jgi:nucleoside-diphosphate-sugar epimerase
MPDRARILVTGASGFIGAALVPLLRGRGHEVIEGRRGDDPDGLAAGCAAVVHLANIAHASADRESLERVNVDGTRRIAEQAAEAGARRFVYLSSVKAAAPDDTYGEAKLAAEAALVEVAGLDPVILRPPLVYGPGVRANFLALMRAIDRGWPLPFASIGNRRSLVYLGNLCDAIARCIEAPRVPPQPFSVSDGAPVSTPGLCRALGAALGRPARLFRFPVALLELAPPMRKLTRSLEVDDSLLRRELGWSPPFAFEDGLRATAAWYRGRGNGAGG